MPIVMAAGAQPFTVNNFVPLHIWEWYLYYHDQNNIDDLRHWLENEQPDVIICRTSQRAVLDQLGYHPPHDIGYANLGVQRMGAATSGFVTNPHYAAEAAIELLDLCVRNNDLGTPEFPRTVIIPQQWNEGSTLIQQQ